MSAEAPTAPGYDRDSIIALFHCRIRCKEIRMEYGGCWIRTMVNSLRMTDL